MFNNTLRLRRGILLSKPTALKRKALRVMHNNHFEAPKYPIRFFLLISPSA